MAKSILYDELTQEILINGTAFTKEDVGSYDLKFFVKVYNSTYEKTASFDFKLIVSAVSEFD